MAKEKDRQEHKPMVVKDLPAAELYRAIYDAIDLGIDYGVLDEWGELRRRLVRWPHRRLVKSGHFVPDRRWRP